MPQIETYTTGSQLTGISDVTGTVSGTKTFLDVNSVVAGITSDGTIKFVEMSTGGGIKTFVPDDSGIQNQILTQLKITNLHLATLTDTFYEKKDLDLNDNV